MLTVRKEIFLPIVGVTALIEAIFHGYRIYTLLPLTYGDLLIPMWMSGIVTCLALLIAFVSVREMFSR